MTGAEALIEQLQAGRVPFVPMLCGNGTESIIDAAAGAGLPLIDTRNEQAASYMADTYARLTGRVGVCVVSSGIAHVNAMSGLLNAHYAGAPMLLITGASELETLGRGGFQDVDQVALCESICKHAELVSHTERIPQAVAKAFVAAASGRPGPTHLTIPRDILEGQIPDDTTLPPLGAGGHVADCAAASTDAVTEAARMIAEAEQPLVIAGSGVFYADGGQQLLAFAQRIGAPIVTPIWDRGVVNEPHEHFMGVIGAATGEPPLIEQADLIVVAGAAVDYRIRYLDCPPLRKDLKVVRIDIGEQQLRQGIEPHVALLADPATAFEQLLEAYEAGGHAEWMLRAKQMHTKFYSSWDQRPDAPEDAMTGYDVIRAVTEVLSDDMMLVIDGGNIGQWLHMMLARSSYPETLLTCGASGVVGYGIPGAMAAKLAYPERRVLLVIGDGSLGFCIPELQSAARHQIPLVAVVADDKAWGIVVSGQRARGARPVASKLGECDWAQVAAGFGARGVRVDRSEQIATAINEGFRSHVPTLVEVPLAVLAPKECLPG